MNNSKYPRRVLHQNVLYKDSRLAIRELHKRCTTTRCAQWVTSGFGEWYTTTRCTQWVTSDLCEWYTTTRCTQWVTSDLGEWYTTTCCAQWVASDLGEWYTTTRCAQCVTSDLGEWYMGKKVLFKHGEPFVNFEKNYATKYNKSGMSHFRPQRRMIPQEVLFEHGETCQTSKGTAQEVICKHGDPIRERRNISDLEGYGTRSLL